MKHYYSKLLFFTFLFVNTDIINAQYLPFVSSKNEWIADYDVSIKNPANEFQRLSFSPDSTLINGKYYRNLIYSFKETGALTLKGDFMREEQGKVYLYDNNMKKERLLYNMNYKIGDTIPPSGVFGQPSARVINVGTIILKDNLPRKFYTYLFNDDNCKSEVTIVEGMGDKAAFLHELYCGTADGGFNRLRCFSKNGQEIYKNPIISKCFQNVNSNDVSFDNFKTSPNPTNGELSIRYNLQNTLNYEWKLYDNLGILKFSFNLNSFENQENINLDFLNNGIYHWQLVTDKKVISNGKMLMLK